jgi:hypothetical protein
MSSVASPLVTYIADLVPEVIARLENRQSATTRAARWLADTLLELTSDPILRDDFDELEVWGAPWELTPYQQEYPFNNFLNQVLTGPPGPPPGTDQPPVEYNQATLSVLLWQDYPTNGVRIKLNPTHYQDADRCTINFNAASLPSEWYRFGDWIGFNPVPNQPYQVQARILMLHPIATPGPEGTQILLSQEWYEVLIWGAVQRGYMELQEYDKANAIYTLLHGDPKYPNRPGLWGAKHTRRNKENYRQSIALRPVIRPYSYGYRR